MPIAVFNCVLLYTCKCSSDFEERSACGRPSPCGAEQNSSGTGSGCAAWQQIDFLICLRVAFAFPHQSSPASGARAHLSTPQALGRLGDAGARSRWAEAAESGPRLTAPVRCLLMRQ